MGLRPLDLDDWLIVDEGYETEMALKAELRAERPDQVFQARNGSEEAGGEALELIAEWVGRRHGDLAAPPPLETRHPLDQAGRLVQEDLCLMTAQAEGYRLEAASVCFPSHWRLADKMGHSLAAIHRPVPHYPGELERRVDTFFERLRPERPVVRRNLSIHDHDDLFRPEPHESADSFAPDPSGIDQVWLRSERQTLRRLPTTGSILFTIKTQQCPAAVLATRPDVAHALAERLASVEAERRTLGQPIAFPAWLESWLNDLA